MEAASTSNLIISLGNVQQSDHIYHQVKVLSESKIDVHISSVDYTRDTSVLKLAKVESSNSCKINDDQYIRCVFIAITKYNSGTMSISIVN